MATRGDWKFGANGCRGASWSDERFWSQQLDGNSAKRLLLLDVLGLQGHPAPLNFIIWYAEKCTRVLL